MTSVTTSITGPIGTCVDDRGRSYWGPLAATGSVPFPLAARAEKFSAGAVVVKVAFVALREVSPVLLLGCYGADRYSGIGSNGALPLGWCLCGYLPVVVVAVVAVAVAVAVAVPGFYFMLPPTGLSFWDHHPLSNRMVGHANSNALDAFVCQRVEGSD